MIQKKLWDFGKGRLSTSHDPQNRTAEMSICSLVAFIVQTQRKSIVRPTLKVQKSGKIRFKISADGTVMTGMIVLILYKYDIFHLMYCL